MAGLDVLFKKKISTIYFILVGGVIQNIKTSGVVSAPVFKYFKEKRVKMLCEGYPYYIKKKNNTKELDYKLKASN